MQISASPAVPAFNDNLLLVIPKLRAYARSLARTSDRADDLVQETLLRALTHVDSFEPGSNLLAWLRVILRNQFFSEHRRGHREVQDEDDGYISRMETRPTQEGHIYFLDVRAAFDRLTTEHRETLMLVASGATQDEAAALCGCAIGTIKSRVSRARARLTELLGDERDDGCPDMEPAFLKSEQADLRTFV